MNHSELSILQHFRRTDTEKKMVSFREMKSYDRNAVEEAFSEISLGFKLLRNNCLSTIFKTFEIAYDDRNWSVTISSHLLVCIQGQIFIGFTAV